MSRTRGALSKKDKRRRRRRGERRREKKERMERKEEKRRGFSWMAPDRRGKEDPTEREREMYPRVCSRRQSERMQVGTPRGEEGRKGSRQAGRQADF